LMLSAASAGFASARTAAPASQNADFIVDPLLVILTAPPSPMTALLAVVRAWWSIPLPWVTYFVREISGRQQAPT
jgi:hypothetical protein